MHFKAKSDVRQGARSSFGFGWVVTSACRVYRRDNELVLSRLALFPRVLFWLFGLRSRFGGEESVVAWRSPVSV